MAEWPEYHGSKYDFLKISKSDLFFQKGKASKNAQCSSKISKLSIQGQCSESSYT